MKSKMQLHKDTVYFASKSVYLSSEKMEIGNISDVVRSSQLKPNKISFYGDLLVADYHFKKNIVRVYDYRGVTICEMTVNLSHGQHNRETVLAVVSSNTGRIP